MTHFCISNRIKITVSLNDILYHICYEVRNPNELSTMISQFLQGVIICKEPICAHLF